LPEFLERDPETGLSSMRQALADLHALTGGSAASEESQAFCHGLVIVNILPNAGLLRLSSERSAMLRRDVAWRLTEMLRPQDSLYALEPWEWLALLPRLPSPASVPLAMLKMHRLFLQTTYPQYDGIDLQIRCGSAIAPEHGNDPQHLIQSARIAALNARAENDWSALYHLDMEKRSAHRAHLARKLQEALQQNELQLFLQPQVNLIDQHCIHAEALLRWWNTDEGAWWDPMKVVDLLEEIGMRPHFNQWLFQRAALYLARLAEAGQPIGISINLTANDLLDPEVPDLIEQALSTWRVSPERLTLEITETAAVQEGLEVEDVLFRLRNLQIRLSIDDFGTGHANMSYLQNMPVQEIKVDKRFVRFDDPRNREITRSILELAHKLGLEVVAEGVENEEILDFLQTLSCERLQGFLYSPALDLDTFLTWRQQHESERQNAA